ncbi:sulfite exporter TauE/SafE family protein [Aliiroseovarius sp. YM-037]|uniref:sulfite exporter TauE/SafE family protein n=1 Tax=Aliiroseovarius sp. YM-037 TaxID=3341728 RepID=UPI003A80D957
MTETVILLIAAFGAGVVNSIAGGGTFLTFPALVYVGVPPVIANATSAVAVFPGYLSAAAGFREEIGSLDRAKLIRATVVSLIGGLVGGLLLLVSSDDVFSVIVPFLLLAATAAFAFQTQLQGWMRDGVFQAQPYGIFGLFAVAVYGGYFNGGLGIVLLALFALWGMENLNLMNGLKNALSFVISAISVATFAVAGIVEWKAALLMAVAAIAGGYAGARLARVLPKPVMRAVIIGIGLTMSVVFFARL